MPFCSNIYAWYLDKTITCNNLNQLLQNGNLQHTLTKLTTQYGFHELFLQCSIVKCNDYFLQARKLTCCQLQKLMMDLKTKR
jgi:hypothetical protein